MPAVKLPMRRSKATPAPIRARVVFRPSGVDDETVRRIWAVAVETVGSRLHHGEVVLCREDEFGGWARDPVPADVRQASKQMHEFADGQRQGLPLRKRLMAGDAVRLDLRWSSALELFARYGPYATSAHAWVIGDDEPVLTAAGAVEAMRISIPPGEVARFRERLGVEGLDPDTVLIAMT